MIEEPTPVVVMARTWRTGRRETFALLILEPHASPYGYDCVAWDPMCGHGGADPQRCIHGSRPADKASAAKLLTELRRIGYAPRLVRRTPADAVAIRRGAAQAMYSQP